VRRTNSITHSISDSHGFVLYRDAGDERFERAAVRRWVGRLSEIPAVGLAGAAVALQAFEAMARSEDEQAVEALMPALEAAGADQLVAAVDEWVAAPPREGPQVGP